MLCPLPAKVHVFWHLQNSLIDDCDKPSQIYCNALLVLHILWHCRYRYIKLHDISSFTACGCLWGNESSSKLWYWSKRSLDGLTMPYLQDDCQLVTETECRHLQSADIDNCAVNRTDSCVTGVSQWLEQSAGQASTARRETEWVWTFTSHVFVSLKLGTLWLSILVCRV